MSLFLHLLIILAFIFFSITNKTAMFLMPLLGYASYTVFDFLIQRQERQYFF